MVQTWAAHMTNRHRLRGDRGNQYWFIPILRAHSLVQSPYFSVVIDDFPIPHGNILAAIDWQQSAVLRPVARSFFPNPLIAGKRQLKLDPLVQQRFGVPALLLGELLDGLDQISANRN